eukprot:NODE_231_length_13709_cov_0.444526.p5 type:complete len:437 gc:universal NODE_231_length_13709_cov_0.444526:9427-8117(-)
MLLIAAILYAQVTVPCANPRIRKDFRTVEKEGKWQRIVKAYRQMKNTGRIRYYAKLHQDIFSRIHGTMRFFTWHRAMLWEFENEIRAIGGDDLTLPYIDWAAEATTYNGMITKSISNDPYYYGKQNGQCVRGQIYESFKMPPVFDAGTCIFRETVESVLISGWADLDSTIIGSGKDYTNFATNIEFSIHGAVHVHIGGDMAQAYSPMDPYFTAHHAFIDSTLNIWQYVQNSYTDMKTSISKEKFKINNTTYLHSDLFQFKGVCATYKRYTETKTSNRTAANLQKRDLISSLPTQTATYPEISVVTETEMISTAEYPIDDLDTVDQYNIDLQSHYDALRSSVNSTDSCNQKIADFYPGSFIPIDSKIPDDKLRAMGLDPDTYADVMSRINLQRDELSKYGNFTRMTVDQVLGVVKDQFASDGSRPTVFAMILFIFLQ